MLLVDVHGSSAVALARADSVPFDMGRVMTSPKERARSMETGHESGQ